MRQGMFDCDLLLTLTSVYIYCHPLLRLTKIWFDYELLQTLSNMYFYCYSYSH